MLNGMELTNFKCFQRQRIDFRPLTLLTGEGEQLDLEVCEVVRRRLGLTLIVDSVESFQKDPFYCTQLLLFLQRVVKGRTGAA